MWEGFLAENLSLDFARFLLLRAPLGAMNKIALDGENFFPLITQANCLIAEKETVVAEDKSRNALDIYVRSFNVNKDLGEK